MSFSDLFFIYLIFVFINLRFSTFGFNLDTKVPIVKQGRDLSYFGFSVAQHQILNPTTNKIEHVLLVGAPRDNITDLSAPLEVRNIKNPGAVYRCPISSYNDDCSMLKIDREVPRTEDDRSDQWMGVSLVSQGTPEGKAVVCSHRYKYQGFGIGLCITLTNELDEDGFLEPCEGLPRQKGHNQYGYCQAGTSVHVNSEGDVLLGVPGSYNWRGSVFKNIIRDSLTENQQWFRSQSEDIPDTSPILGYYSYLGMSTQVGKLFGNKLTYVSGAPRAKDFGQVLLFTQRPGILDVTPDHYLDGEQFGSCFGYSVSILDINNDKRDDLVVGAPFYHKDGHGGAIYIYMNTDEGISSSTVPKKILNRKMTQKECIDLDCESARFGFSLAKLGDIDFDGFQDLAVGAPYEGAGAIYIFRGSAKGLIEEPSQRLSASEILSARPLTAFGYSLSGGIDLDSNGYPDLVAGSFNSNKVVMLRSRPVIQVSAVISSYPELVDPTATKCPKNGKSFNCFQVRVCFRFRAEPKEKFTDKMDLDYSLIAEKFSGRSLSRVYFQGRRSEENHIVQRSIRMNEQKDKSYKCRDHLVYIKKNTRDFLNPVQFQLSYKLKEPIPPTMTPGQPLPDINTYPVLNVAESKHTHPVDFIKQCGADNKCQSNLKLYSYLELQRDTQDNYILKSGIDNNINLHVDIHNVKEDAHESRLTITLPENLQYKGLSFKTKKYSCLPRDQVVECSIGNPLRGKQQAKFTMRLDARRLKATKDVETISLRVNTTSQEIDDEDDFVLINIRVITETDMLVRGTSSPSQVFYGGTVLGESAIKYGDQIGSSVTHGFEVKNNGEGKVMQTKLLIDWPYEAENGLSHGKRLLYLMEEPKIDWPGRCTVPDGVINLLNITQNSKTISYTVSGSKKEDEETLNKPLSRKKRDKTIYPERIRDPSSGRYISAVIMDCKTGTAKCFRIECTIGELTSKQSVAVKLRSRLWNSTFLEDYRNVDQVRIQSHAQLVIDDSLNIKQTNYDNDFTRAITFAIPDVKVQDQPGVPLWVIIIAACGGFLLLLILVLLLWKCGFFRRHRYQSVPEHRGKVEKKRMYYDDDDYHDY